jgi:hypothetical protein
MSKIYLHVLVALFVLIFLLRLYYQSKAKQMTEDQNLIGRISKNALSIIKTDTIDNAELKKQVKIINLLAISMIVLFFALAILALIYSSHR